MACSGGTSVIQGYLVYGWWRGEGLVGWTSCAITRCREIMTPQLSIVKTRFAKASLRPRCARHRSWRATCRLPNRRAGTLTSPTVALVVKLPNERYGSPGRSTERVGIHYSTIRPSLRLTHCWPSNVTAIFVLYWSPMHFSYRFGLPLNLMDLCPEDVLDGHIVCTVDGI